MCGIVGYFSVDNKNAKDILIEGLKRLEYRGYDSWGIAIKSNPSLVVEKFVGPISTCSFSKTIYGNLGIGHTRWATHGKVDECNAHPHVCCESKIAIVHNGIIENCFELRKWLLEKGHVFKSETDSEVIAHLIEEFMKEGMSFGLAFFETLRKLKGSYAIVAMHKDKDVLLCAKKDSPLVIGIGDNEYFIASDVFAFLHKTKNVLFLEDGEMAIITREGIKLIDVEKSRIIERLYKTLDWEVEDAKKGNYPYFIEKEIMEQPEVLKRAIYQPKDVLSMATEMLNNAYGVFMIGCGTSFYACLSASYIFSKVAKKHINVVDASEFKYHVDYLTPNSLVIAVSQSGETADVLDAIKMAKTKGSKVMAITNVVGSSLMRMSDFTVPMNVGPEICVVSTKAYSAQLSILTLLAYSTIGKSKEAKSRISEGIDKINKILQKENLEKLEKIAEKLIKKEHIFCMGRGVSYPSALEAALKIKEISYIHAEGFSGGFLKHGSIALIEEGTPCIVFAPEDETYEETISNAMEVKSRGAYVIGVSSKNHECFDDWIKVPKDEIFTPVLQIIPIQYIAYKMAVLKGNDPDKPRNLAKSVTVK